jgi:hypothetical protein
MHKGKKKECVLVKKAVKSHAWSRLQQLAAERDDTSSNVEFVFALCRSTMF